MMRKYHIRSIMAAMLFLILPVPYASMLAVLTAVFGDNVYVHVVLCMLYLSVSGYGIERLIRKMGNSREKNRET